MKFFKLSKASWLILSVGIFIVVLAGLGVTRSQQIQEQGQLEEELGISQKSLDKVQVTDMRQQLDELNQKIESEQLLLDEARNRLDKTVVSVDVTDQFFDIADYCGVVVITMSTSSIQTDDYEGIGLYTTALGATAQGELDKIIKFVISLNNDYTTGLVQSFQIDIPEGGETPSVNIQMVIYSYEGIL